MSAALNTAIYKRLTGVEDLSAYPDAEAAQTALVARWGTVSIGGSSKPAVWNGNRASEAVYDALTFREGGGSIDRRFMKETGAVGAPIYDMELWTQSRSGTALGELYDLVEQLLDERRGAPLLPLTSGVLKEMAAFTEMTSLFDPTDNAWAGLFRWRFVEVRY